MHAGAGADVADAGERQTADALEGQGVRRLEARAAAPPAARTPPRSPRRTRSAGTPSRCASAIADGATGTRSSSSASATPDAAARCAASAPSPSLRSIIAPRAVQREPPARARSAAPAARTPGAPRRPGASPALPGLERGAGTAQRAGDPDAVARARARAVHRPLAQPSTVTATLHTGPADRSPPTTRRADFARRRRRRRASRRRRRRPRPTAAR